MFNINIITKYFNNLKTNYTLQKNNAYSKISNSPKLKFNNNKYLFDEKFNEYIYTFIALLSKKTNIELELFYENLKTLKIKEKRNFNKFFFIKSSTRGQYFSYENKILIQKEDNFYTIYHELLHCASTRKFDNITSTGFHKFAVDVDEAKIALNIGRGLNEGYTSLLEKRYFDCIEHTQKRAYVIETFISSMLEEIVSKEKMEKLYFNADFDGLVDCLKEFSHVDDVYLFFEHFDKISMYSKKNIKPKEVELSFRFIACYLLKAYICKLIYLLQNKKITREEFEKLFDDFVEKLSIHSAYDKKNTYDFLTEELTNKILDEVNEDLENNKKNKILT